MSRRRKPAPQSSKPASKGRPRPSLKPARPKTKAPTSLGPKLVESIVEPAVSESIVEPAVSESWEDLNEPMSTPRSSMRPSIEIDFESIRRKPIEDALLQGEDVRLPPPPAVPSVEGEPIAFAVTPPPNDVGYDEETPEPPRTLSSGFYEQAPWETSAHEDGERDELDAPAAHEEEHLDDDTPSGVPRPRRGLWTKLAVAAAIAAIGVVSVRAAITRMNATSTAAAARATLSVAGSTLPELPKYAPRALVEADEFVDADTAKRAALAALEVHDDAKALRAATRATELDATDGEAWLILGAVHQDAGRTAQAFECYRTCATQGRVDPKGECKAMLASRR